MDTKVRTLSNGEIIFVNENGVYYVDSSNDINRGYIGCEYAESAFANMNLDKLVDDYEFRLYALSNYGDMVVMQNYNRGIKLNEGRMAFNLPRSYIEKRIRNLSI